MTEKTTKKSPKPRAGVSKMVRSKFEFSDRPSRLRVLRIQKQLSQDTVAARLGYAHTTYGEIERGRRPVRPETATLIANVVGAKVENLFAAFEKKGKSASRKLIAIRAASA